MLEFPRNPNVAECALSFELKLLDGCKPWQHCLPIRDMNVPQRFIVSRHLILLCLLLALFVVSPLIATFRYGVVILNLIGAAVLLAGVYSVGQHSRLFAASFVIAVAAVLMNFAIVSFSAAWLIFLSNFSLLVLLTLFSSAILREVLRAGKITADKIYGAICVYLLIGYAWAFAYALLEQIQPGSFSFPAEETAAAEYIARVMRMRYFSFVTLTTVGFGDILPRSSAARTFATLEAIMGQMYLAVLVARLVGLHIVHANADTVRDK